MMTSVGGYAHLDEADDRHARSVCARQALNVHGAQAAAQSALRCGSAEYQSRGARVLIAAVDCSFDGCEGAQLAVGLVDRSFGERGTEIGRASCRERV